MKINKFLEYIQKSMLFRPEIDINTVKYFMNAFEKYLSKKEYERFSLTIQLIKEFNKQQLNLETFDKREIEKELETDLNNLKPK